MDMAEREKTGTQLYYRPNREKEWRTARPYGIDYKGGFSRPKTHNMKVRLDGGATEMTKSQGNWSDECAETEDGQEVVLTYSDGSVKESGTIGSGAGHVKGCSLSHSHQEYPGTHTLVGGPTQWQSGTPVHPPLPARHQSTRLDRGRTPQTRHRRRG